MASVGALYPPVIPRAFSGGWDEWGRGAAPALNSVSTKERNEVSFEFLVFLGSKDHKSGMAFPHTELGYWPLWFSLPNIVRTYTEASRASCWEKGLLRSYSNCAQSCTVVPPLPGRTPALTKPQTVFPPSRWDLLFWHLLPKAAFERRFWVERATQATPPFPSRGRSRRPCYPEFQGDLCQRWIGGFVLICMGRRVRPDRYLVVPLVLFQSYFGTFWKNNKMTGHTGSWVLVDCYTFI